MIFIKLLSIMKDFVVILEIHSFIDIMSIGRNVDTITKNFNQVFRIINSTRKL